MLGRGLLVNNVGAVRRVDDVEDAGLMVGQQMEEEQ